EAVVVARQDQPGDKRLVGYVVGPETGLRDFLAETLPEYMVPAVIVSLDEMPLTAAGKVDRDRLPEPEVLRPELATEFVTPGTATERALAAIWSEALGIGRVGLHDDFHQLGGDSILTIQVVARAKQAGLPLTPRLAVRHNTIAALAAALEAAKPPRAVAEVVQTGDVPLTPIQKWWVTGAGHVDLDHYNQWDLFTIPDVRAAVLERALLAVVEHHDALRLRVSRVDGEWRQQVAGRENSVLVREGSLSQARELHESMSLANGPLVRALIDGDRVLLAVHHWAVDTVSWPIIRSDVETAYRQLAAGQPVSLPETTSFTHWAHKLAATDLSAEKAYWAGITASPAFPVDYESTGGTIADTRMVTSAMDAVGTESLLRKVPAAYGTRINEVLLAALGMTLTRWAGGDRVLVDLEGHGREDLPGAEVDLSRTVGWFTSLHPVSVELPASRQPDEIMAAAKTWTRSAPYGGIGYGLLGHGESGAQSVFNYHGQVSGSEDTGEPA